MESNERCTERNWRVVHRKERENTRKPLEIELQKQHIGIES